MFRLRFAFLALLMSSQAVANEISLDSALEAYEDSCRAILSFDIEVSVENSPILKARIAMADSSSKEAIPQPTVEYFPSDGSDIESPTIVSRQYFDRKKFRLEVLRVGDRSITAGSILSAWDLETYCRLSAVEAAATLNKFSRSQVEPVDWAYQNTYLVFDGNYTLAQFVRDRPSRIVKVDDTEIVIEADPVPGTATHAANFGLVLRLDPQKGFMPNKITYSLSGSSVPQSEWSNELFQPISDVWVPINSSMKIFVRDENSKYFGKVLGEKRMVLDPNKSRFNIVLDQQLFSPSIPEGYKVTDERTNTSYIVGEDGVADNIDHYSRFAGDVMGSLNATPSTWRRWIPVFGATIALIIFALVIRYRR